MRYAIILQDKRKFMLDLTTATPPPHNRLAQWVDSAVCKLLTRRGCRARSAPVMKLPPGPARYVVQQFAKVLPHDNAARRSFVQSGGLQKIQECKTEVPRHARENNGSEKKFEPISIESNGE